MNKVTVINGVSAYLDEKGIAFLNLEDVARGLGFVDTSKGTNKIRWARVKEFLKEFNYSTTSGAEEFIPENIFYKLCMKAKNEVARKFQDLVCDEILPSIRQNGGYILSSEDDTEDEIMAKALLVAQKTIERKSERIKKLELDNQVKTQQIAELQPKATYYDLILQCKDLLSATVIAKDYGMSAKAFNKLLHEEKIQFKQSDVWFIYQKYANKGYTQTKTQNYNKPDGTQGAKPHMYWTQKGRLFLYDFLKAKGVVPMIEREVEN